MYRGSSSRSTLTTKVITGLDMCKVCTEAIHRIAFWKQKLSQVVDMCKVCTEAVHRKALWQRKLSQVWTCVKYVPRQSIAKHFENKSYHRFRHVWGMYRGSSSRSTLTTKVITGLDMCKVCTEAIHRIAFWKQKLSQVVDMCKVCTEAVHREALWQRKLSQVWTCVKYVPRQSIA